MHELNGSRMQAAIWAMAIALFGGAVGAVLWADAYDVGPLDDPPNPTLAVVILIVSAVAFQIGLALIASSAFESKEASELRNEIRGLRETLATDTQQNDVAPGSHSDAPVDDASRPMPPPGY